ncbi:acyltransferase family protein [Cognatilysobacter tabacisoli]|uniref:acyltransferase family protein n=1 Tax=Cognatilysobacter tabacisoli TaxID=2315424 RepID=UPI000E6B17AD|nr:acyltransferase family protein [Lysobacter tabacisoli]
MERRHDLDAIRVAAFGLLVLYHVGMYYVSWDWHVKSPAAGETLEPLMLLTAPWRLALLFLVSGAATAFLLDRGTRGFIGARSWRLLVPLLFGMLVVVPPQAYYEVMDSRIPGGYHDGYLAFWGRYLQADPGFCDDDGCLDVPTWNHLWFVAYLWVYTVIAWALARLAPRAVSGLRSRVGRWLAGPAALWAPIALVAIARIALVGRFESTHGLVDDWYNHAQYLPVFLLGFLLARADGFWQRLQRLRWLSLGLAGASYAFLAWYFYGSGYGDNVPHLLRGVQRAVWAVNQWSAIAAVCGFAYRFRNANSGTLRYLVPAVFPVYILHQTVIVVAAYRLRPLAMPPLLEGLLLVALTFAACFGAYEVIRRVGWLRPLFGLKRAAAAPSARLQTEPAP